MTILVFAGVVAYLFAAFLLRPEALAQPGSNTDAGEHANRDVRASRLGWSIAALGIAAHLAHHASTLRAAGGIDLHFFAALSWVGVALALALGLLSLGRQLSVLGVVVLPLAAFTLALDFGFGEPNPSISVNDWRIGLHAWLALLAYATLTIAALVASCAWLQDRALRTHRFSPLSRQLPPLVLIEQLLFQTIAAGFVLLTLTILTGVLFVEDMMAQHLAHKTVLTILSWLTFGALLFGRWRYGWRGRRALHLTLGGMALLALAFFGSKFVLELVLQRF